MTFQQPLEITEVLKTMQSYLFLFMPLYTVSIDHFNWFSHHENALIQTLQKQVYVEAHKGLGYDCYLIFVILRARFLSFSLSGSHVDHYNICIQPSKPNKCLYFLPTINFLGFLGGYRGLNLRLGMAMGRVRGGLSNTRIIPVFENHTHTRTHTHRVLKINTHTHTHRVLRVCGFYSGTYRK